MDFWQVSTDPKSGRDVHSLRRQGGHALLLPVVTSVFESIGISASLWDGTLWWPLHTQPNLAAFEAACAIETQRAAYNQQKFSEALRRKRTVLGEHAGYCDLFVPVVSRGKVAAVIVSGPFSRKRPTSAEVLRQWRAISGRQGRLAEPEFEAYLRLSLETLVLDRKQRVAFQGLLERMAKLMASEGRADDLTNQALELRRDLARVRLAESMWAAAKDMIDERSAALQFSAASAYHLRGLGLPGSADQLLVGLMAPSPTARDSVEELVLADALQRALAEFSQREGGMIAGRVGDRGIVFLLAGTRGSKRERQKLAGIGRRARELARRDYAVTLHFGATEAPVPRLSERYLLALGAAESALLRGESLCISSQDQQDPGRSLRSVRERLARLAEERPELLPAEFDRYAESVVAFTAARPEPARTQLELAFERCVGAFVKAGSLDPRAAEAFRDRVDHGSTRAGSVSELLPIYRSAVAELSAFAQRPVVARQDRSLARVIEYIHQHSAERLSLEQVARVSGFSRTYFSELFKRHEGTTFEKYVLKLRLDRVKQLLTSTELGVIRIAEATGFSTPQYLNRVFRQTEGTTPLEYRRRLLPKWFRDERKSATHPKKQGSQRS